MARYAQCANTRNRLFVIDHVMVFWDRAGGCADDSYAERLYGATPARLLADLHDSIAGPQKHIADASVQPVFDVIVQHLDQPDLGLGRGQGHSVQAIPF